MNVDELLARYPRSALYVGSVGAMAYLAWITVGGK